MPWTEKPCRLQSMGSQRVVHNWAAEYSTQEELRGKTIVYNSGYPSLLQLESPGDLLKPYWTGHTPSQTIKNLWGESQASVFAVLLFQFPQVMTMINHGWKPMIFAWPKLTGHGPWRVRMVLMGAAIRSPKWPLDHPVYMIYCSITDCPKA